VAVCLNDLGESISIALQDTLVLIDISRTGCTTLAPLAVLRRLQTLDAADNAITDFAVSRQLPEANLIKVRCGMRQDIEAVLAGCTMLRSLDVSHNPVVGPPSFRFHERTIILSSSLSPSFAR